MAQKLFIVFVAYTYCLPIVCQSFQFTNRRFNSLHHHEKPNLLPQRKRFVPSHLHESYTNVGIGSTFPSSSIGIGDNIQIAGRSISDHVSILDNSLRKLTGKGIRERIGYEEKDHEDLYQEYCMNDRYVIVSHGTEDDPIYNFSNVAGLEAFVRSWDDFILLPSRLSVVLQSKDEELRIELMSKVTNDGFVEGASGIRVRGDGKFIQLVDAVVRTLGYIHTVHVVVPVFMTRTEIVVNYDTNFHSFLFL